MYSRLGTKVTLLQRSKKIVPNHELEISYNLKKYFVGEGIEIITTVNATNEIAVRGVENCNKSLELKNITTISCKTTLITHEKIERSSTR